MRALSKQRASFGFRAETFLIASVVGPDFGVLVGDLWKLAVPDDERCASFTMTARELQGLLKLLPRRQF